MHSRIIRAIARKDTLDLLLNKQTLVMLMTPIIMAFLFLFIGTVIGSSTTEILVYDPGYQPSQPAGVEQVLKGAFSNVAYYAGQFSAGSGRCLWSERRAEEIVLCGGPGGSRQLRGRPEGKQTASTATVYQWR